MTRPVLADDGVTVCVDFLTEGIWRDTLAVMQDVGKIASEHPTIPLQQVRKLLAQTAVSQFASSKNHDWVNFAVETCSTRYSGRQNSPDEDVVLNERRFHTDSVSSRVNGVYQETSAVLLSDRANAEFGRFIGTMVLGTVGNEAQKSCLLSTCLTQVYGDEQDRDFPDYIIGRSGRIDSGLKAQQLVRLASTAVTRLRGGGGVFARPDTGPRLRETVPTRMRVRFCSLLNALSVTQKELSFFRNQVGWLSGSLSCVEGDEGALRNSSPVAVPAMRADIAMSAGTTPTSSLVIPEALFPDVRTRTRKGHSITGRDCSVPQVVSQGTLGDDSLSELPPPSPASPNVVLYNNYFEGDAADAEDAPSQADTPVPPSLGGMDMQDIDALEVEGDDALEASHSDVVITLKSSILSSDGARAQHDANGVVGRTSLSHLQSICGRNEDLENEEEEREVFIECPPAPKADDASQDSARSPVSEMGGHASHFSLATPPTSDFEFPAAMQDLGVEYALVNYIANWPLSLRMGTSQPSHNHNVVHPLGYRQYIKWLSEDVWNSLSDEGCEVLLRANGRDGLSWSPHRPASSPRHSPVPPPTAEAGRAVPSFIPRSTLHEVRSDIRVLIKQAETAEQKHRASELHMAYRLLQELHECKGSNFRRRAAELLQLCVLELILKVVPFFNCKSGVDRTGICAALWTSVYQVSSRCRSSADSASPETAGSFSTFAQAHRDVHPPPPLWLLYMLAMNYALLLKTVKGIHGCGVPDSNGERVVPLRQLATGSFNDSVLLPFAAAGSTDEQELLQYSAAEELAQILATGNANVAHPSLGGVERRAYGLLKRLFFATSSALLPRLQHAFFVNIIGTACKIAAASTGVHGLKYGDAMFGGYNALGAQFMPTLARPRSGGDSLALTENRRGLAGTDAVVSKQFAPYLVAAASARGT